jgi:hypothetical protein
VQNSLERLLEGLEHTLRSIVAPSLTDSYLLSQVNSVAEIIGNLSTRIEWRSDQLLEVVDRVRPVLEQAVASIPDGLASTRTLLARPVPSAATPNAELLGARDDHLLALREVQQALESHADADVEAAVRAFLTWHVESESALLRTASRAPKK